MKFISIVVAALIGSCVSQRNITDSGRNVSKLNADAILQTNLPIPAQASDDSSKQGEHKIAQRYFRPIQPTAFQAHMLANKQAKQEFGEKLFRLGDFKKKTEDGLIKFTATVPFESNDLKAEVHFSASAPPIVRLSLLTSSIRDRVINRR